MVAILLIQITLLVSFMSRRPKIRWWQLATLGVQLVLLLLSTEWVAIGERRRVASASSCGAGGPRPAGAARAASCPRPWPGPPASTTSGAVTRASSAAATSDSADGARRAPECSPTRDLVETADHHAAHPDGRALGERRFGEAAPVRELLVDALPHRVVVGVLGQAQAHGERRALAADDPLGIGGVVVRQRQTVGSRARQQRQFAQRVRGRRDPLDARADRVGAVARASRGSSFSSPSSTPRTFSVVARVRNWVRTNWLKLDQPALLDHRLREFARSWRRRRGSARWPGARRRCRTGRAALCARPSLRVVASDPRKRSAETSRRSRSARSRAASSRKAAYSFSRSVRAPSARGPATGMTPSTSEREVAVALVAARDFARREQGVDAARADLVGAREHGDGVDGLRHAGRRVAERLEELQVRRVQMPHEVDDGIGRGGRVLRREEAWSCARRSSSDSEAMPGVSMRIMDCRPRAASPRRSTRHPRRECRRGRSRAGRARAAPASAAARPRCGCSVMVGVAE